MDPVAETARINSIHNLAISGGADLISGSPQVPLAPAPDSPTGEFVAPTVASAPAPPSPPRK
jgi:hypothetical protein